jgi:hypothetical protein
VNPRPRVLTVARLGAAAVRGPCVAVLLLALAWQVARSSTTSASPSGAVDIDISWYHGTAALVSIAVTAALVRAWPAFGARRPEGTVVRRLHVGPAGGCLAGAVGALVIHALALQVGCFAGGLFERLDPPRAERHVALACDRAPILDAANPRLALRAEDASATARAVRLRPLLSTPLADAGVGVGVRLTTEAGTVLGEARFVGSGRPARIDVPRDHASGPAWILERTSDSVGSLRFGLGRAELVLAPPRSPTLNLSVALAFWWLATALGLAVACVLRDALGPRVLGATAITVTFVAVLSGLAPAHTGLEAVAAGRWVLDDLDAATMLRPIAAVALVVLVALVQGLVGRGRTA